jgi:microcystin-dependent protein
MLDIEAALSSSLDRDGKGGMRAALPMGGNKITGLAPGTNPTDAATVSQITGTASIPIGVIVDFWGATPPEGYLFAAGQEISRTTYAALFAVMGTSAGAGNGSTTFNLPDYRGRVSAGRENMATPATTRLNSLSSSTLGGAGGAQTHTLMTAEMPSHTHAVTDPGHAHGYVEPVGGVNVGGIAASVPADVATATTDPASTGITLANTGGGAAHNNVQPTIICNKIIRAL